MNSSEKIQKLLIAVGITTVTFLFFNFFYAYHLFLKEQTQLFFYNSTYFFSYLNKPAWLASLSGDFLTQFFYMRYVGPLILALIFLIEWQLGASALKKIGKTKHVLLWALLPVATDFVLHLNLYHSLRVSLAYILVLILFLGYTKIKSKGISLFTAVLISFVGYSLAGTSIFLFPFLYFFYQKGQQKFISIPIFLIVLINPFLLRGYYLLTFQQAFIFPALHLKSLILSASFALIILLTRSIKNRKPFSPILHKTVQLTLLAGILIAGVYFNSNFTLEKILAFDSETYFGNTEKVIQMAEKTNAQNRIISYYTNMALSQKGELAERLLEFYQPATNGLILPVSQKEHWQTILFSNELFYLLGDMNLAQHSAMLGNTFSPYQRSSRMIKRLAEINMVNEDYPGAEKYLRLLNHTLFYKKWAQQRLNENKAGKQTSWLLAKRSQIAKTDTIRNSFDYIESIRFLVQQNPGNRIAVDYMLSFYLLDKDLDSFKAAYDKFVKNSNRPVAKVYGEALLIKLFQEKVPQSEIVKYRIHPEQLNEFIAYTKIFDTSDGDIDQLKSKFKNTYWFYYHFATMQEENE